MRHRRGDNTSKRALAKPVAQSKFNPELKAALDDLLLTIPDVTASQMFGYPTYCVNKRLFACVYEQDVGIRVPATLANRLLRRAGIHFFQPLGRPPMRQWIAMRYKNKRPYHMDMDVFRTAIRFVKSLPSKSGE